ncbi:DNA repair protein XRCC2 isoform X2 [Saimiri boliviensis]|uniref:DNA repair protein XRCC2 isoform X2 n=1 Tax=Saimiri boliviensis TaxID=27679 RepID=UPI003D77AB1F
MCSDFHRTESGTELLARLEGRSSLKEIEPSLFADEDSPVHAVSQEELKKMVTDEAHSEVPGFCAGNNTQVPAFEKLTGNVIFLNFMAQKGQEKQKCFIT